MAPGGKYLEKVAETTGMLPLWHFPPSCQKTFRAGIGALIAQEAWCRSLCKMGVWIIRWAPKVVSEVILRLIP